MRGQILFQAEKRLKSVIGSVVRRAVPFGCVDEGKSKARLAVDGEARHGDAIVEAGGGSLRLERLRTDGREEDGVKFESTARGASDSQMAAMRRVETSSKKGDAMAVDCRRNHGFMVML